MVSIICPTCRSTIEPYGHIDFNAASLQVVRCPVCNTPNSVPAGFPVPMKWDGFNVIQRNDTGLTWETVTRRNPVLATNALYTGQGGEQPSYLPPAEAVSYGLSTSARVVGQTVTSTAKGFAQGVGETAGSLLTGVGQGLGIGNIGLAVIGILLLLFFLKYGNE